MPHVVSVVLGVAFVVLAVVLVVLQAWLWNPKYWDPIAKKSHAPPRWVRVHRVLGYVYAAIYVVMMWHMVPRLWDYAIELPARTVAHAIAAIVIGVVLCTKIAILRWFRHFEESMPTLGFVLLLATVVLGALSIPFGLRAYADVALDDEERDRVQRILSTLEVDEPLDVVALTEPESLARGRSVLTTQCTQCHDARTILAEPRTGASWHSLVVRMSDKPTLGLEISDADILTTTAYLIAITPTLQEASAARYRDKEEDAEAETEPIVEVEVDAESADAGVPDDGGSPLDARIDEDAWVAIDAGRRPRPRVRPRDAGIAEVPAVAPEPTPVALAEPPAVETLVYSQALARSLLDRRCMDCHGDDELDEHGGDDRAGWSAVMRRMIARGASLTSEESRVLVTYLTATRPL